jgi:hypothetical protein
MGNWPVARSSEVVDGSIKKLTYWRYDSSDIPFLDNPKS